MSRTQCDNPQRSPRRTAPAARQPASVPALLRQLLVPRRLQHLRLHGPRHQGPRKTHVTDVGQDNGERTPGSSGVSSAVTGRCRERARDLATAGLAGASLRSALRSNSLAGALRLQQAGRDVSSPRHETSSGAEHVDAWSQRPPTTVSGSARPGPGDRSGGPAAPRLFAGRARAAATCCPRPPTRVD
jgi:hypothetical protein